VSGWTVAKTFFTVFLGGSLQDGGRGSLADCKGKALPVSKLKRQLSVGQDVL
jgi:hypothetical protein